jgi:hypothetical protein
MQVSTLPFIFSTWGIGIGIYQKILGIFVHKHLFFSLDVYIFIISFLFLFILLFEIFSISKNNIIRAEAAKVLQ